MNIIWLVVIILVILVVVFLGLDFTRFVKAAVKQDEEAKLNGVKVDAGGILFVQGNRTYYQMPNGVRRKISDRPMDLKAGSKDMNYFLSLMEKARCEIRSEEHAAMESVAKDIVSRETSEEADARR